MNSSQSDRNLLSGFLALQMGIINVDQLVAALRTWVLDKRESVEQILVSQGVIDDHGSNTLESLVTLHLKRYGGDLAESLAALSTLDPIMNAIEVINDPDLNTIVAAIGSQTPSWNPTPKHRPPEARTDESTDSPSRVPAAQRFRVLRSHARGGLGEVFVAKDEELGREVALKEIQTRHLGNPDLRSRFVLEAEINGNLEHPGIVPVYGLGSYEDGRPFYAMRFIQGDSLKEAVDSFHKASHSRDATQYNLRLRELLNRFTDICDAIGYAHSRGVLHRDLKPSNVMLGQFGETLIIDWGLAKATGHRNPTDANPGALEGTLVPTSGSGMEPTIAGATLGTPGYMSPEQAHGNLDEMGPSTDIYGLGAVLYYLLTGQAPAHGKTNQEILDRVKQGDIPRPRTLCSRVPAALEAICLKALSLEPAERYASARDLAKEIEQFQADEPVSAYPDPLYTTLWRWVRRHRTTTAVAAAVLFLGVVGLSSFSFILRGKNTELTRAYNALAQSQTKLATRNNELDRANNDLVALNTDLGIATAEAEARLDQAMESYTAYFTGFNEDILTGKKLPQELLEPLLEKPRQFYEVLTAELAVKENPTLRERLLLAEGRNSLGRILWILGRHAEAREEDESAIALFQDLIANQPGVLDYSERLARTLGNLGLVLTDTGPPDDAINAYRQSIELYESLAKDQPSVPSYRDGLARNLGNLGDVLQITGVLDEAIDAYNRSIEIRESLVTNQPDVLEYREGLATYLGNLGVVLANTGASDEAINAYERAIELYESLAKNQPSVPDYRDGLARNIGNLGDLRQLTGALDEAIKAYNRSIEIRESLVLDRPGVPEYREGLATHLGNLAVVLANTGASDEAIDAYERAIELYESLAKNQPSVPDYRDGLARNIGNLGNVLQMTGVLDEAIEAYSQSIEIRESLVTNQPDVLEYREGLATYLGNLAVVLANTGASDEAIEAYERSIALYERLVAEQPQVPEYRSGLGRTLNNLAYFLSVQGRFEEARFRYEEAIGHQRIVFDQYPQFIQFRLYLSSQYGGLALCERALGQTQNAIEATRKRAKLWPENPGELYNTACELSLCILSAQNEGEVEDIAAEAVAMLEQAVEAGWTDADWTQQDSDLDPLRDRDDFKQLLAEMYDKTFPAMPFVE